MLSIGPGMGWWGGFVYAHCNMFAVSHPSTSRSQHGAVAAAKQDSSWASFLRGSAWTYGHGLQGVAWWRARAGGRPRWVRMHCGRSVRNPNEPRKSCSERWWWGGGEKFAFMRCNVFPPRSTSDSQHGAAAAALRDDNLCYLPCDLCDPLIDP